MADSIQYTLRGPKSWEARLDALIPFVEASPFASSVGRVTRATVLRIAVQYGLRVLEGKRVRSDDLPPPASDPSDSSPPASSNLSEMLPPPGVPAYAPSVEVRHG